MSLQFVEGSCGAGKSWRLYQEVIRRSEREPDRRLIVIVPEQASLQTQQILVQLHPRHALTQIEVLSFNRLAYRIFEELSLPKLQILDDTGKSMILRKAAGKRKKELAVFGASLSRGGFIGEMKSILSEFFQYGVRPEAVRLEGGGDLLRAKFRDFQIIMEAFQEAMEKDYVTAEELLQVLCRHVEKSALLKRSIVVLDEFTGFTPVQYQLLEKLMTLAEEIWVSVTLDRALPEAGMFSMSRQMRQRLCGLAGRQKTEILPDLWLSGLPKRYEKAPELFFLGRSLGISGRNWEGEQKAVRVFSAANPEEEVRQALRQILRLVREEGYRYREIAVVAGDLSRYAGPVAGYFRRAGLPYFIDQKKSLLNHPLVDLIRCLLEAVRQDFSYDAVFRLLKNPLLDFSVEQISLLENYALETGVRGLAKWKEPWEYRGQRMSAEEMEEINLHRSRAVELLQPFCEAMKGEKEQKASKRLKTLREFLEQIGAEERLDGMREYLENAGEKERAEEYGQSYGKALELFGQFESLMGEETMGLSVFTEILEAGFAELKVGLIPAALDRLVVGDLRRTRLFGVRALFMLGCNEGSMPPRQDRGGLLSDLEREFLKEQGVELAPTRREESLQQQFYLYRMLGQPSEHLYLSYSQSADGKISAPSGFLRQLKKTMGIEEGAEPGLFTVPADSLDDLAEGFSEASEGRAKTSWKALYRWFSRQEKYRKEVEGMERAAGLALKEEWLDLETALRLYGDMPVSSVTRLERFAACPYSHFLAAGLGLLPRKEYRLEAVDFGNIFHGALEEFFLRMRNAGLSWEGLGEGERETLAKESVETVAARYGNTILRSTARNAYLEGRLLRVTKETVWALQEQLKYGAFVPGASELLFGPEDRLPGLSFELKNGMLLALRGRIDRVDLAFEGDRIYVKVIDYKSGRAGFDAAKVYHGLQLQLLVYLEAAVELVRRRYPGKEVIPAGVFYYRIQDPLVEIEGDGEEERREALLKELRMDGLANKDPHVLSLLDHSEGKASKVVSRLERNADGTASGRSRVAGDWEFGQLRKFAMDKVRKLGSRIASGEIAVSPYEYQAVLPCMYCPYQAICGFDRQTAGCRPRHLEPMNLEDFWNTLREEGGRADGGALDQRTEKGH